MFLDGTRLGDPALVPGWRKAKAGDIVSIFANSLAPSPAGVVSVSASTHPVTITIGSVAFPADATALVAPGEFQINFTVPKTLSFPRRRVAKDDQDPGQLGPATPSS